MHPTTRHCPRSEGQSRHDSRGAKKGAGYPRDVGGVLTDWEAGLLAACPGEALELDELCVRICKTSFARKGSLWLWLARCRRSGQIVSAALGDRSAPTAWVPESVGPVGGIAKAVSAQVGLHGRLSHASVRGPVYWRFFAEWQHTVCAKGDGRTSQVEGINTLFRSRVSHAGVRDRVWFARVAGFVRGWRGASLTFGSDSCWCATGTISDVSGGGRRNRRQRLKGHNLPLYRAILVELHFDKGNVRKIPRRLLRLHRLGATQEASAFR